MAVMCIFTACSNKVNYDEYKTKIIGVWCSMDGPEFFQTDSADTDYYYAMEFTADNVMALHEPSKKYPGYVYRTPYELRDDIVMVGEDGSGRVRVAFDDEGNLLLTDGQGTKTYRHPTVAELGDVGIYPLDQDLYNQVVDYTESKEENK